MQMLYITRLAHDEVRCYGTEWVFQGSGSEEPHPDFAVANEHLLITLTAFCQTIRRHC